MGTAQYVSPEILSGRGSTRASDLWAIGCILYQMLTGLPPFQSQSEYLIFQKIQKLDYSFHEGFNEHAKHLIQRLLVIEPSERLGAKDKVGPSDFALLFQNLSLTFELQTPYTSIRAHPFFTGMDFDRLSDPSYLPASVAHHCGLATGGGSNGSGGSTGGRGGQSQSSSSVPAEDPCWARKPSLQPGAANLARLMLEDAAEEEAELDKALGEVSTIAELPATPSSPQASSSSSSSSSRPGSSRRGHVIPDLTDEERRRRLDEQIRNNKFHRFVEGNLILKQGILDKKKGLWARRRMFLLTEGPHLYYVDPDHMVLKGEIPWSDTIRPEIRDFKIFFVHTPNRVYYLIDPDHQVRMKKTLRLK